MIVFMFDVIFGHLYWVVTSLILMIRRLLPQSAGEERSRPPRSVLLIQLDHLGDGVLSGTMLAALQKGLPETRIDVLASPSNAEFFEGCPEVSQVHVCKANPHARGPERVWWAAAFLWWAWRLHGAYDWAVDIRGEVSQAVFMWLIGARNRLGWSAGGGGFLLTQSCEYVPGRHEVLSRKALLHLMGIELQESFSQDAWYRADAGTRRLVRQRLASAVLPGRRIFVVHLGAGTPAKRWPLQHWRRLVLELIENYNAQVVLVGGPELSTTAHILIGAQPRPEIMNWVGHRPLAELAAILEQADLFLGADSGPAHMAAAVGTPAVVIFSGTNLVSQWKPWGAKVQVVSEAVACAPCGKSQCPLVEHPCLHGLAPQRVLETVESMFSGNFIR